MSWLVRKIMLLSFWVGVTFSALLAILAISIGEVLPYLDYYRPQIERNLQQITGYPVVLESIDGRLEGIDPTFSVGHFRISPNGQDAISVEEMRIRIDTVKSLLSLSPQFTYIRFVNPVLSLQETDDQWRLSGAIPTKTVSNDVGIKRALDYLSAQRNFSIINAQLSVHSDRLGEHFIEIPQLYIFQKAFGSLLNTTFYLDDYETPFQIDARLDDTGLVFGGYRIKAAISTPLITLPIKDIFPDHSGALSSAKIGGDIWVDALVDKEIELQANNAALDLTFTDNVNYQTTSSFKFNYNQDSSNGHLDISELKVKKEGESYSPSNITYDWSSSINRSSIRFDRVDFSLINQLAPYFLKPDAKEIMDAIAPVGVAENGLFQIWKQEDELSFEFVSNIRLESLNAYKGIPKVSNVDAILGLSNQSGYVDFHGYDSQVLFDVAYDDAWDVDFLSGRVDWEKIQETFLLTGKNIAVERNGAELSGGFRLEVIEDSASWMLLDLHGRNIPAEDRLTYIPPKALKEDVKNWVNAAYSDVGQADSVDVLVQGVLEEGSSPHVRVNVNASDLDVTFNEEWPTAENVTGSFVFDQEGVSVKIDSATLLDLAINDIFISVPIIDSSADWLNLKGEVNDESSLIIETLEKTPLIDTVLKPFSSWQVKGDVKSRFDIAIPFSEEAEPEVDIGIVFENNSLLLQDLELDSIISDGQFNFSSSDGITNSEFNVEGLGGFSHLKLTSSEQSEGDLAIIGDISGTANVKKVAQWRKLPDKVIQKLSGDTTYTGKLLINQDQNNQVDLTINSQLVGIDIDLPVPIGKKPLEVKPLEVALTVQDQDITIESKYDRLSNARLLLRDGSFVGGDILLNSENNHTAKVDAMKGLTITGFFEHFNVQGWLSAMKDMSDKDMEFTNETNVEIPSVPEWLKKVDLIVDEIVINPVNTWNNVKVTYDSIIEESVKMSSDEVSFSFFEEEGLPNLHFSFLSWNTTPVQEVLPPKIKPVDTAKSLPEAPISASQIPNIKLSVDQFYLNNQPYGDWQVTLMREGNLVTMDPITTGLQVGDFNGRFTWLDDGDDSAVDFSISIKGEDLAELTKKFSNDSYVTSEEYEIKVDLGWGGHPFYFNRETVSGDISFSSETGTFHQVDKVPPFLKALGIFNVGALTRRLSLDFSDVYDPGLAYDEFSGVLALDKGMLTTTKPITLISPSAELSLEGEANIAEETLDETLTAAFPITGTLPLVALIWSTPQIAGLLYITDRLFGSEISKVTSIQYKIEGSFDEPVISPMKYKPVKKEK